MGWDGAQSLEGALRDAGQWLGCSWILGDPRGSLTWLLELKDRDGQGERVELGAVGGKVEVGETFEAAAVREIGEEIGQRLRPQGAGRTLLVDRVGLPSTLAPALERFRCDGPNGAHHWVRAGAARLLLRSPIASQPDGIDLWVAVFFGSIPQAVALETGSVAVTLSFEQLGALAGAGWSPRRWPEAIERGLSDLDRRAATRLDRSPTVEVLASIDPALLIGPNENKR